MDVRLLYLKDNKMQNMQELRTRLREVPSAISFSPIHCESDGCSSYTQDETSITSSTETMEEEEEDDLLGSSCTQDDASVEMEEEDDLLGLDLLLDDEDEEEFNLDKMEAETR